MAPKSVKPKSTGQSPVRSKRAKAGSVTPEQPFIDPLADIPRHGPVADRFEIQPGDIAFITVGSIEVVTHPPSEAGDAAFRAALRKPPRRPKKR